MALTAKQERFAEEYLVDLNATQAAIRAGYSEKTAAEIGRQNLIKLEIQKEIQEAIEKRSKRTEITVDRVLNEYAKIGFFDPRKLFDKDGKPIPINELDADTAAAIGGLDVLEEYEGYGEYRTFVGHTKKYKIIDKKGALDSIARHLGMFNDKIEHSGTVTQEITHDLRKLDKKELADLERILSKTADAE
jgi:phage terminase small subunit